MNRQTGLILTTLSVIFCLCPGISICVFGGLAAVAPATDPTLNTTSFWWLGALMMMCGLGMSLFPVGIGLVFYLRRKPQKTYTPQELDEKLPPAI